MNHRILFRLFPVLSLALAVLFALPALSYGQTFRGGITGTVTDASGAVLPGVQVVAVETATGISYKAVSSSAGEFAFSNLPVGNYTVTVAAAGFATEKVTQVAVVAATSYVLPVKLSVASSLQTVQVTANELTLDTVTDEQANAIPEQQVQSLPNSNRDFTQMLAQNTGFAGLSTGGGALMSSVDGTRTNSVNWQIEGTDNNDLWWNIPAVNQSGVNGIAAVLLPIDAIENFSFVTSGTTAIGRDSGGTANLTIKSGTNSIHGSGYYYNHNEFFQANNPFSGKEMTRDQHYGFSAGGPIRRNKTFIFIGFEHEWFDIGAAASGTEPSAAYQADALAVLNAYGIKAANPVAENLLNGSGSAPGLWPASALTGPDTGGNYASTGIIHGYSYNGIGKIDENFTDKDHLAFTYFIGQGIQTSPLSSDLPPYFQNAGTHIQNYSLVYNRVFSPAMTNQLAAGVSYFQQVFVDADTNFDPQALGLDTGVTGSNLGGAPYLKIGPPSGASDLNVSNSGFDPLGPTAPEGRTDITGHLNEDLNWTKGAHQLHFGGEIRKAQVNEFYLTGERGTLFFDGTQGPWSALGTACASFYNSDNTNGYGSYSSENPPPGTVPPGNVLYLADFLAGCFDPAHTNLVEGNPIRLVYVNTFSLYGQDSYKLTKKLSVDYGIRYDYEGPVHTGKPNLSVFDPSLPSGLAVAGQNVANIYPKFWSGWSPRVGFSYQVGSSGTTVLRGGYGIYNDSIYMKSVLQNAPLANTPEFGPQLNPAGDEQVVVASALPPIPESTTQTGIIVSGQPIYYSYQQALSGSAGVITTISTFDPHFRPDYMQSWDLNLQQAFGPSVIWQLGYVGTKGTHLMSINDINAGALNSLNVSVPYTSTTCAPQYSGATPTLPGNDLQCSRPYFSQFPNFGVINEARSNLGSNYNSLQTSLRLQNYHNLAGSLSYTWSHALDYETGALPYLPQNPLDETAEYGNSDWDVRQTLTGTVDYTVPTFGRPSRLTKGWEVDSGFSFHGGLPYTVTSANNPSGNGEGADRAVQVIADPEAGVSHAIVDGVVQWFNPSAFVDAPTGTYSPTRRGQNFGPGYSAVDLALLKSTQIRESVSVQFRADMFNIFNRTNFAPMGFPTTSETGQLYSTIGAFVGNPGVGPGEPFNALFSAKILF